jgi:hypothetical protein
VMDEDGRRGHGAKGVKTRSSRLTHGATVARAAPLPG